MSIKAQGVGSRGPYSTRRSRVLYGASRPHTECFINNTVHTVHAITNLLCFHLTKLCCMTKVAVLYASYSTASSFDPPTQNTIRHTNGHHHRHQEAAHHSQSHPLPPPPPPLPPQQLSHSNQRCEGGKNDHTGSRNPSSIFTHCCPSLQVARSMAYVDGKSVVDPTNMRN